MSSSLVVAILFSCDYARLLNCPQGRATSLGEGSFKSSQSDCKEARQDKVTALFLLLKLSSIEHVF